jgi:ribA/ribD-fused uncharacterized protein
MRETDSMILFWDSIYSNFYECPIIFNGIHFKSSEQLFMYLKAKFFHDEDIANQILDAKLPNIAKGLGRKVKNFNEGRWIEVREEAMFIALKEKFTQNENLKQTILNTGFKIIVEASPYDTIWGIGIHFDDDDCLDQDKWKGFNLLGECLMKLRECLRSNDFTSCDSEEIRIISLFGMKSGFTNRYSDIAKGLEYAGLYSEIM